MASLNKITFFRLLDFKNVYIIVMLKKVIFNIGWRIDNNSKVENALYLGLVLCT